MKTVALYTLLALAIQHTHADNPNYVRPLDDFAIKVETRSTIGDKLREFLEGFKETMKTGNESLGVPQMDPLYLEHQEFDIEHYLIKATGQVNDVHLERLSDFVVEFADFKIGKKNFSIHLRWPTLKGDTLFDITEAKIMDYIPVFGVGNATFEVTNLTFATNAKLKLDMKNKNITILEFQNTTISIDALKFDAKGLFDDEEFSEWFSGIISNIAPPGLVDFQEELVIEVNAAMLKVGNELLPKVIDKVWGIIMP